MLKVFGVDLSKWNGNFNFTQAIAEGVKFVVLRGAYHETKDTKWEAYYAAAKAKGLPVGAYQYSMATTVTEAREEANFLVKKVLYGKPFELPIYLDVEDPVQKALGKSKLTAIVKAWCAAMENNGYYPGIYASLSFFKSYLNDDELTDYPHWVAEWRTSCSYKPTSCLGMWQFGGETNELRSNKVAGQVCDQDYLLVDYPKIIKRKGLNGLSKTGSSTIYYARNLDGTLLCVGDLVKALQKRLNRVGIKPALVTDGKCGTLTDRAIRWFQKKYGLLVDGKAGVNTRYALAMLSAALTLAAQVKQDGDWHYKDHATIAESLQAHEISCNDCASYLLQQAGYLDADVVTGHVDSGTLPKNSGKLGDKLKVILCGGKAPNACGAQTGDVIVRNGKNDHSVCLYISENGAFKNVGAQSENQVHHEHLGPTSAVTNWWNRNGVTCIIRAAV